VIAYVDSSVILGVVLGQPARLPEWKRIGKGVVSRLAEVECMRTMDRLRLAGNLTIEESAHRRESIYHVLEGLDLVELTSSVLHRAAQPMVAPLGTLDAIHLATAELWRETRGQEIVFATHDRALGLGARASGFKVIGL
jgi:predicted nucleic acid-binding protein